MRATTILPPHGQILDLGCGLGHLMTYLDEKQLPYAEYHGIDVSSRMIDEARKRYSGRQEDISFERRNVLEDPLTPASYDTSYILSVLGYPIGDDPMQSMMGIIENAFAACRTGIVFSQLVTGRKEGLKFTTVPDELAARCEIDLGARAEIDDDGKDFTYLIALRH